MTTIVFILGMSICERKTIRRHFRIGTPLQLTYWITQFLFATAILFTLEHAYLQAELFGIKMALGSYLVAKLVVCIIGAHCLFVLCKLLVRQIEKFFLK